MSDLTLKLSADWHFRDDLGVVEGRMVPFGERAMVMEDGEVFWEEFDPGSLNTMCQVAKNRGNAGWISFNLEHDESLGARIGFARSIEQRPDGAWAQFQLYRNNPDLPKVRDMLSESHTGLSVMFADIKPPRLINEVRHRTQVSVSHVAATPMPTYASATITTVRETEQIVEPGTPSLNEWTDWLASLGTGA